MGSLAGVTGKLCKSWTFFILEELRLYDKNFLFSHTFRKVRLDYNSPWFSRYPLVAWNRLFWQPSHFFRPCPQQIRVTTPSVKQGRHRVTGITGYSPPSAFFRRFIPLLLCDYRTTRFLLHLTCVELTQNIKRTYEMKLTSYMLDWMN